jgi:hypothetical protein
VPDVGIEMSPAKALASTVRLAIREPRRIPSARLSDVPRGLGRAQPPSMLMIILIVFLVLALGGGGWAHSRYGYAGWSPAGLILLVFAVLWMTGNLHT